MWATGSAVHRAPGVHVLRYRMFDEPFGREDSHRSVIHLLLGDETSDTAEVVGMGVGVDDRLDLPVAAVVAIRLERRTPGPGRQLSSD